MRVGWIAFVAVAVALAQVPPGTIPPRIVSKTEPEYTAEASRARACMTSVTLSFAVDEDGLPRDIRVVRAAGFGLDEMATEALKTWRFEPARKDGTPVSVRISVDVHFRSVCSGHEDQHVRLNFTLPPGTRRPELARGRIPENSRRGDPQNSTLRIALTVRANGGAKDLSVLESKPPQWGKDAVKEMRHWRFHPATRNSDAVEVKGVLELTRGSDPPRAVVLRSSDPVDTSLPAPELIAPADGAVFDIYPRRTIFQWKASAGAASYLLECDYEYRGVWDSEVKGIDHVFPVRGTQFSFDFVGAQPGRWRVWAVSREGKRGVASQWRKFRYLR